MSPAVRAFLIVAHDRWCRPWMVPAMIVLGIVVWVVGGVMAYHDVAGGLGAP